MLSGPRLLLLLLLLLLLVVMVLMASTCGVEGVAGRRVGEVPAAVGLEHPAMVALEGAQKLVSLILEVVGEAPIRSE